MPKSGHTKSADELLGSDEPGSSMEGDGALLPVSPSRGWLGSRRADGNRLAAKW